MPERISRPPVRLRGGLPDGNLNGTSDVAKHFLKAEPDDRYAIVQLGRRQLVHDDETEADVAVLGVIAVEFADQDKLQRMLLDHRELRTGHGTLPFDEPAATDADRARELEHRIRAWADHEGLDARAEWVSHFGPGDEAPVGPTGAQLIHLIEFVGERGIVAQPLASVPAKPDDTVPNPDASTDADDAETSENPDADDEDPPGRVVQFSGGKK